VHPDDHGGLVIAFPGIVSSGLDKANGWIARGLMLPVDPYVLLMSIWSVTQFYADSAVQVRQLIKPGEDDWQPDREALVKQLTTLLLRGCGIQTP
jgi:TetR/AcrR family transcriptional regulator